MLNGRIWRAGEAELLMVVVRHVLSGEFAHGVGLPRLSYGAQTGEVAFSDVVGVAAEYFAGGEVDEPLDPATGERGLLDAVGTNDVPRIVVTGIFSTVSTPAIAARCTTISHPWTALRVISASSTSPSMRRRFRCPAKGVPFRGVPVAIVQDHDPVVIDQTLRQRSSDEPRSAR